MTTVIDMFDCINGNDI